MEIKVLSSAKAAEQGSTPTKTAVTASGKKKLSPLQKEYRKFFKARLKASGKDHPFAGDADEIADFMGSISEEWAQHKADKGL